MEGRSRTSSTAVPDTVLPRQPLPALLYLLHLTARDGGNAKGLLGTILALQSSSIHRVVCFAAPARLGNCSGNCSCVALPSYFPVGRRCNGGNAKGLAGRSRSS